MLRAWLLVVAAAAFGCERDTPSKKPTAPPDLAAPIYFCPDEPPPNGSYACDPAAIPSCSFPAQELTCDCLPTPSGGHALYCPVEDAG